MKNRNQITSGFRPAVCFFLLLLTGAGGFLRAQEEVYFFHRLTASDNLTSQNFNYYVYQDSEGFVWISSINGLNRFDGREVRTYLHDPDDPNSLADNNIQSRFFEDEAGRVWFCNVKAIQYYDRNNDRFGTYNLRYRSGASYRLLWLDTLEQKLWVRVVNDLTQDELLLCSLKNPEQEPILLDKYPMAIRSVLERVGPQDHYLILPATDRFGVQVRCFSDETETGAIQLRLPDSLGSGAVRHVFIEGKDRLWAGGTAGLVHWDLLSTEGEVFNQFNGQAIGDVIGITPVNDRLLIVATRENGLYYFARDSMRFASQIYEKEEDRILPFIHQVDRIYLDSDHNLWISTSGQGVFFTNLNKKKFEGELQRRAEPVAPHNIRSMAEDKARRIWCLTREGVIVVDSKGDRLPEFDRLRVGPDSIFSRECFYIFCDQEDRIWLCSQTGLYVLATPAGTFQKVPVEPEPQLPGFTFIHQLRSTRDLLVSSQSSGVYKVEEAPNGPRLVPYREANHPSGIYTRIFEDAKGNLILRRHESEIRIYRRTGGHFRVDTALLFPYMVNGMLDDSHRSCTWIATDGGLFKILREAGRYRLHKDTLIPFQTLNGLLQDDATGQLWLSTNRGLLRYDPGSKAGTYRIFSLAEGLQAPEFNFWSYLKLRDGRFAFGGVNGINLFYPSSIRDLPVKAKPVVTEILVNDVRATTLRCDRTGVSNVSRIRRLKLPFTQNTLSFRFAPLEYSDPAAVRFRYQMVNLDTGWVEGGREGFARYANLQFGKYWFKVDAANSDGVWSETPYQLEVVIRPPFYRTWWFLTLMGMLVLALAGISVWFRIRQIRKKEAFLRKEAEYRQKVAETETAILRLQMNPHFIFNSMNSISSYIIQKDIDTANDYLGRFSGLMRKILKLAARPLISVGEEIELLEEYMQTEAMRFEKKFEYSIEIGDEIDEDEVLLPTMILQPFVENAIWHGFRNLDKKGKIKVGFGLQDGGLRCYVEDNGVGREAARSTDQKHESRAMDITRRRLDILRERYAGGTGLHIADLFDENQRPSGTRVVLTLPLL